jgi:hypothetical protein
MLGELTGAVGLFRRFKVHRKINNTHNKKWVEKNTIRNLFWQTAL